ncbi:MAG TPA: small, acid-soluble spore protein, alpha/beta type [Clostridia bacterium]
MSELDDKLKMEVVTELGLLDKVKNLGWKSLSAKETGKIGGLITKKKKLAGLQKTQQL